MVLFRVWFWSCWMLNLVLPVHFHVAGKYILMWPSPTSCNFNCLTRNDSIDFTWVVGESVYWKNPLVHLWPWRRFSTKIAIWKFPVRGIFCWSQWVDFCLHQGESYLPACYCELHKWVEELETHWKEKVAWKTFAVTSSHRTIASQWKQQPW